MAEIDKTENYGLKIFSDEQTTLTFSEFRKMIAGIGESEDDYSNMQKIDAVLKQCSDTIISYLQAANNYTDERIATFETLNDDGSLVIGGEDGRPIEFHDGTQISYLKNGVFTVNGIEVDYIRIVDYLLKYNSSNGHLQISRKPKFTGGVL